MRTESTSLDPAINTYSELLLKLIEDFESESSDLLSLKMAENRTE